METQRWCPAGAGIVYWEQGFLSLHSEEAQPAAPPFLSTRQQRAAPPDDVTSCPLTPTSSPPAVSLEGFTWAPQPLKTQQQPMRGVCRLFGLSPSGPTLLVGTEAPLWLRCVQPVIRQKAH